MSEGSNLSTRARRARTRGRDALTPLVLVVALLAMGLVGYGQFAAEQVNREQAQLTPIGDRVAKRVGAARVYLVQALAGDESVSISEDVFGNARIAFRYVDAALNGGPLPDGTVLEPMQDPRLHEDLRLLWAQVDSFITLSASRWNQREDLGAIGTEFDRQYDELFDSIVQQTNLLSADIAEQATSAQARVRALNAAVLAMLLVLFVGVATATRRTRNTIIQKTLELETRVDERTAELARSEARTTAIVNTAVDAIVTVDRAGRIRSVNPATERIFGYAEREVLGADVGILMSDEDAAHHAGHMGRYLRTGERRILGAGRESIARRKDGTLFPIDISISEAKVEDDILFVGLIRDITERKRVEAELQAAKTAAEEAATHDPLTGLWNHNRIIEILIEEMARSERQDQPLSLAMLDLDHFKQINDTYGHVVGDEVLRDLARRLEKAIRVYDAVGRFGGEEFMVVLPGTDRTTAEHAAERIRADVAAEPVLTSAGALRITASLGVVTRAGERVGDATALLVAADTALYEAKENGRNRVEFASMAGHVWPTGPDRP
jgi:diguanylate cyclase (GGDEF)-like protein/PAS domain S-box-containing protein